MEPIRYETWQKLRQWIEKGADMGSDILVGLFIDIPWLAGVLYLAVHILGWGLETLLDALPHENEPRPDRFNWLPLHKPGEVKYVQDPRWVVKNPEKYNELNDALAEVNLGDHYENFINGLANLTPVNSPFRKKPIEKIIVPIFDDGKISYKDHPRVNSQLRPGNGGPNATYAGIGF